MLVNVRQSVDLLAPLAGRLRDSDVERQWAAIIYVVMGCSFFIQARNRLGSNIIMTHLSAAALLGPQQCSLSAVSPGQALRLWHERS